MKDINKPTFHNVPKPLLTIEQFEDDLVRHFYSEQSATIRSIVDVNIEEARNAYHAFLEDCIERHPEMIDDVENVAVQDTPDGVNLLYLGEIVGMMKWGKPL